MTLNPPHMTMTARAAFTIAREKSQRLRTVGLSYVPSAGVWVTKLSEEPPRPSAQSTNPRIASNSAFPTIVNTAFTMSPAQFSGFSPPGIQSVGLGIQSVRSGMGRSTGMAWGGASGPGWAGGACEGGELRSGMPADDNSPRVSSASCAVAEVAPNTSAPANPSARAGRI